MRTTIWVGLAGVAVMMACSDHPVTAPGPVPPLATVFSATGRIGATVNQFRAILGAVNGGIAGEQPAGRREINWDDAAAIPFNNRNDFPADFFNTTVKAGAVFTTPRSSSSSVPARSSRRSAATSSTSRSGSPASRRRRWCAALASC